MFLSKKLSLQSGKNNKGDLDRVDFAFNINHPREILNI